MNPPGWAENEPCPGCGSWDITEWQPGRAAVVWMAWECRDCGYLVRWTPHTRTHLWEEVRQL